MHAQETRRRTLKQARRTFRDLVRVAYPYRPPANAVYERGDYVELAALAAGRRTSTRDASTAMRSRGNLRLPHADTFHKHVHPRNAQDVLNAFHQALDALVALARAAGWLPPGVVAIDGHDEPYYGRRDNDWVMGTKRKKSTNWAHKYLTSQRLDAPKLHLGLQPVTPKRGRSDALKALVEATRGRMDVTLWLLDREFYNRKDLATLKATGRPFVVPVPADRRSQDQEDAAWRAKVRVGGRFVAVRPHDAGTPKDPLPLFHVYQWRRDESTPSGWRLFVYACPDRPTPEQADARAQLYRKRWNIESGYRLTEEVRLRTTTTHRSNRLLLSCLALLFDALWRLTAHAAGLRDPKAGALTSRQFRGWFEEEAILEGAA